MEIKDTPEMQKAIRGIINHTDMWPWYWLAYGEKCYAFAVVAAIPLDEGDPYPEPGTRLMPHTEKERLWVGENGVDMTIQDWIMDRESQDGDDVCRFIAASYAAILGPHIYKEF